MLKDFSLFISGQINEKRIKVGKVKVVMLLLAVTIIRNHRFYMKITGLDIILYFDL